MQRESGLIGLLILSLLAAPVEYVAHEGAHLLAARALGAEATLHFNRVTLDGGAQLGPWQSVVFAAAGPALDWIVGLLGIALLVRGYTPLRLVLAIWVARPLQFLPALAGIDLGWLGVGTDLAFTDEAVMAGAAGLSPPTFIGLELVAAAPLLALIVWSLPPRRSAVLAVLTVGVLGGWAAWLVWGRHILP